FSVKVAGDPIPCSRARAVIAQSCGPHPDSPWSCFSIRISGPFVVWFPTQEVFDGPWSTAIVLSRYPCSQARVTPRLFRRSPDAFPTRRQLVADDLIRCHLLTGLGMGRVIDLIGSPDE